MNAKRRTYKDRRMQAAYDAYRDSFDSGVKGWVERGAHGLWREDGSRFRGASGHVAFWNGYDGLTLSEGRPLYIRGSISYAAYMAGRDCARETEKTA